MSKGARSRTREDERRDKVMHQQGEAAKLVG